MRWPPRKSGALREGCRVQEAGDSAAGCVARPSSTKRTAAGRCFSPPWRGAAARGALELGWRVSRVRRWALGAVKRCCSTALRLALPTRAHLGRVRLGTTVRTTQPRRGCQSVFVCASVLRWVTQGVRRTIRPGLTGPLRLTAVHTVAAVRVLCTGAGTGENALGEARRCGHFSVGIRRVTTLRGPNDDRLCASSSKAA